MLKKATIFRQARHSPGEMKRRTMADSSNTASHCILFYPTGMLFHNVAIQERHDLCAGAGSIRAKCRITCAGGYGVFRRPQDSLCIIRLCRNILEWVTCHARFRLPRKAPEEGDDLRSGASSIRAERCQRSASSNALLDRPEDGVVIIFIFLHILQTGYCARSAQAFRQPARGTTRPVPGYSRRPG